MDFYNQKWVLLLPIAWGKETMAITLGQTAYYSEPWSGVSAAWHRHEDCHKLQWKREGRIKFAFKFIWYSLKYDYWVNPYEVEARRAEGGNHVAGQ